MSFAAYRIDEYGELKEIIGFYTSYAKACEDTGVDRSNIHRAVNNISYINQVSKKYRFLPVDHNTKFSLETAWKENEGRIRMFCLSKLLTDKKIAKVNNESLMTLADLLKKVIFD